MIDSTIFIPLLRGMKILYPRRPRTHFKLLYFFQSPANIIPF